MSVRLGVVSALLVMWAAIVPRAYAQGTPTGEVQLGKSFIEPAYDDMTGNMIFLLTPLGAPFPSKANAHAVAPLYLIVYPKSAGSFVGTMNCMHDGGDNCPDHGPDIAGLAMGARSDVYGAGVLGHDHLVDAPGGSDFNVAWQVHVLLFTNSIAARTHITTEEDMHNAIDEGDLVDATPDGLVVFNCSVVPKRTFDRGTPVPPAN